MGINRGVDGGAHACTIRQIPAIRIKLLGGFGFGASLSAAEFPYWARPISGSISWERLLPITYSIRNALVAPMGETPGKKTFIA